MKFEQLIQIYWSRGFLYNGKITQFDVTLKEFFKDTKASFFFKNKIIQRFELTYYNKLRQQHKLPLIFDKDQLKLINMYLSANTNINDNVSEAIRYSLIRNYLIKSFRGRCYALGKPARGQRNRSNGRTAYKYNRVVKSFIFDVKKFNNLPDKKDKQLLNLKDPRNWQQSLKKTKKPKIKMIFTKKKANFWF